MIKKQGTWYSRNREWLKAERDAKKPVRPNQIWSLLSLPRKKPIRKLTLGSPSVFRYLTSWQVINSGMLAERGHSKAESAEILDYLVVNSDKLRELALRAVCKLSDLYKSDKNRWRSIASVTMHKRG